MKKAKQMTLVEHLLGCYRKRKKENFPYFRNKKRLDIFVSNLLFLYGVSNENQTHLLYKKNSLLILIHFHIIKLFYQYKIIISQKLTKFTFFYKIQNLHCNIIFLWDFYFGLIKCVINKNNIFSNYTNLSIPRALK